MQIADWTVHIARRLTAWLRSLLSLRKAGRDEPLRANAERTAGPRWSNRFYSYFFSYMLLVLTLLLLVSGVVYETFIATLTDEAVDSNIATLTQIKNETDTRLNEMNRMALQIAADPLLTPFMVQDGYGGYQAVAELKKFKSTNLFIQDIALYYVSTDPQLFASSGAYDTGTFFQYAYRYRDWGANDFIDTLPYMDSPVMRPLEPVTVNGALPARYATYFYPLPVHSTHPYGVAMFLIDESAFAGMMQNALKDYSGVLYILDEQQQLIVRQLKDESEQTAAQVWEAIRARSPDRQVDTVNVDGRGYSVVRLTSDFNNWSYITVMPTDQLMNRVNQSRLLFNCTVAIVFVLGLAMAFAFSLRNYRPLQKLVQMLSLHHPIEAMPAKADELTRISYAFGEVTKQNAGLMYRLSSQTSSLKDQYLLSLLRGKIKSAEELEELAGPSSLQLDKPFFAVLLFLIDDYGKFQANNSESMQDIVKYSLLKVVEELSAEIGTGHAVELMDDRGIVLLLNINEGFDQPGHVKEIAGKAKRFFRQYFHLTVTVGIGDIGSGLASIRTSFLQAGNAARHRFVKGGDRIISFSELETDTKNEYWYPIAHETQLVKAMKQGNSTEARAVIRDMLGSIVNRNISIHTAELLCFDIVNTMLKTLIELDVETDEAMDGRLERLVAPRFETIEELETALIRFCDEVCGYVNSQKVRRHDELLDSMMAYVNEHYRDSSISLETIAARFGFSPSYATRFFKDQSGYSLMRYIDMLRMEKAKQLLRGTDKTLKDIMDEVGYVDSTNFIRKFKKSEGVTPIQYRNIIQGG